MEKFLVLLLFGTCVTILYLFLQQRGAGPNVAEVRPAAAEEARPAATKEVRTKVATRATAIARPKKTKPAVSSTESYEPFQKIVHNSPRDNYVPFFKDGDFQKFQSWSGRSAYKGDRLPKVLIFTWCTEDTFKSFVSEVYWKACYAHTHGFDLVFTSAKDLTGVAQYDGSDLDSFNDRWYSDENMWAWVHAVHRYLYLSDYDYVFVMEADVLILPTNLEWPVWAWDRGHDFTVMDDIRNEPPFAFGFNINNLLLKPSDFSKQFLAELFDLRKEFRLKHVNAPFLELMLNHLGYEAEANDKPGYLKNCSEKWALPTTHMHMVKYQSEKIRYYGAWYSECFYLQLERLAGPYGGRQSRKFGFHPTFFWDGSKVSLPAAFSGHEKPIGPWANCWWNPRRNWADLHLNCFAYHWDGAKDDPFISNAREAAYAKQGTCPDPTFDWAASPYNFRNRDKQESARHGNGRRRKRL